MVLHIARVVKSNMSKALQKKRSCIEHITQTKMDLGSRFERRVSVEEQSVESRRRANAMQKKTYTNWISVYIRLSSNPCM